MARSPHQAAARAGRNPARLLESSFKDLLGKVTDDKFAESPKAAAPAEVAKVADVKEKADLSRDFDLGDLRQVDL